MTLISYFHC